MDRKYKKICGWVLVKVMADLPNETWEDYEPTYITRIMHDDGRGGNHIEELTRDDIWKSFIGNDGKVYWLDEGITIKKSD